MGRVANVIQKLINIFQGQMGIRETKKKKKKKKKEKKLNVSH